MRVYESNSEAQTFELGRMIGEKLKNKDTVALFGELGTGKTVFVKGIARGLGICEDITSPTFAFVNEYHDNKLLYHFDFYRIDNEKEADDIGFLDYFTDDAICVIEWADKVSGLLPAAYIKINIKKEFSKGEDYRRIEITGP